MSPWRRGARWVLVLVAALLYLAAIPFSLLADGCTSVVRWLNRLADTLVPSSLTPGPPHYTRRRKDIGFRGEVHHER